MDTQEATDQIKKLFELSYSSKIKDNIRNGKKHITINYKDIISLYHELGDYILDYPEEALKIMSQIICDSHETDNFKVLIKNLPESTKIHIGDITDQVGKLVSVEGYVMKPSQLHTKCTNAKFECPSCGSIVNVRMEGHEYKQPSRCGCGRKGKFIELSKSLEKSMTFEIMEGVDPDNPATKKPSRRRVYLSEPLTDDHQNIQPGKKVKIIGTLELEPIFVRNKQTNEFKTNIMANNLELIKQSWDSINISKKDKEKFVKMSKKEGLLDDFAQSLAPEFESYDLLRKTLILQHVGGQRIFNKQGNMRERGCIHIHLCGNPGTGKSQLMKSSIKISPLWDWTTGKGMTGPGVTGSVVKDEYGQYTFDAGPAITSSGGILGADEWEKINKEDFGYMANIMAEEVHKVNKANINMLFEAKTSILSTSNPLHGKFIDEAENIINQFAPIPKFILDRYDLLWAMKEDVDEKRITEKYMALHRGDDSVDPVYTIEEMRKYIACCRRIICTLDKDIAKYFNKKFYDFTGKDVKEGNESSHRLMGNLMRLSYAHCKFSSVHRIGKDDKASLRKEDIDFAFSTVRYSFKLLGVTSEDGLVNYENLEEIPKKKEINKYYAVKDAIKNLCKDYKNIVPEDKIYEEAKKSIKGMTLEEFDKEINKLKKSGDIFEPRPRNWGFL